MGHLAVTAEVVFLSEHGHLVGMGAFTLVDVWEGSFPGVADQAVLAEALPHVVIILHFNGQLARFDRRWRRNITMMVIVHVFHQANTTMVDH